MKTTFKLEKEVMTLSKAPYKTKQMAELFSFMQAAKGRHVTVNEICDYFKAKGFPLVRPRCIGTSKRWSRKASLRNMSSMERAVHALNIQEMRNQKIS